jgi:prevent-host-death family protein
MSDVPIGDLDRHLSAILRRVRDDGEIVTVTHFGSPVAQILPHREGGWITMRVQGATEPGIGAVRAREIQEDDGA